MIGLGPKLARSGRHLKETKDMTSFLRRIRTINILVENILDILLKDIFRHLILQRIRINYSLRIFTDKDKDKDFWAIWEVYAGSIHQNFVSVRHFVFCS